MQLSEYHVADIIHLALNSIPNSVNIDNSVGVGGILVKTWNVNDFEVAVPKKDPQKSITVSYYRNRIKPPLENALVNLRFHAEAEMQNLQMRIQADWEQTLVEYANPQCINFNNDALVNRISMNLSTEYMAYASSHFHYLYGVFVGGFKDLETYLALHIVVGEAPRIWF